MYNKTKINNLKTILFLTKINFQILGTELCLSRVNDLIKEALSKADLNNNIKLKGLVCIHLQVNVLL